MKLPELPGNRSLRNIPQAGKFFLGFPGNLRFAHNRQLGAPKFDL